MKNILIISLLLLIPLVFAQTSLEVSIIEPTNFQEFDIQDITISATMNKQGNMSYKLDNNNFTLVCSNCSNFSTIITNLAEGQHTLEVLGEADNETNLTSVNFSINLPNDELEVMITQPQNLQEFNTSDITISAEMNLEGDMSYRLNIDDFTEACVQCTTFSRQIINLSDGTHQLTVLGEADTQTTETFVTFFINTTSPPGNDSIPPPGNDSNISDGDVSRFSLGFQKLPKQFATGDISNEELTNIILNNKLNPGIINRLAKTGKLSQENIDAIIETQFLPPGILNKLLGLIGFARNNNLEEFIENINLTDQQLSNLIEKNIITERTTKKLIKQQELGEKSINAIIKKSNEKIIIKLAKEQTLTSSNIQTILQQNPSNKVIIEIVKNQILEEDDINTIIESQPVNVDLNKHQKLNKKQKNTLNIEEPEILTEEPIVIGKQKEKTTKEEKKPEETDTESTKKTKDNKGQSKKDSETPNKDQKSDNSGKGSDSNSNSAKSDENKGSKSDSGNPGKTNNDNSGKSSNSNSGESNPGKGKGKP